MSGRDELIHTSIGVGNFADKSWHSLTKDNKLVYTLLATDFGK